MTDKKIILQKLKEKRAVIENKINNETMSCVKRSLYYQLDDIDIKINEIEEKL